MTPPELGTFYEIAILIGLATALGLIGTLLRQPMVVAFIAAGLLAGPDMLNIVRSTEAVALLSQVSIAVLLFLVGLKLDTGMVRSLGRVAVATGLGQVAFTSLIGFVLCYAMGFDPLTALYVAVALTFSSTIIIVKLLTDKREVDSLHGRIALGFLIVQDLFVVFAMVVVSAVGLGGEGPGKAGDVFTLTGGTIGLLALAWVFIRYLADPLTRLLSRSGELLVIFAVAWAAGLAAVADAVGLGKELGGLLAGVTLASTPVRDLLGARLASLRDFLLLFFFLSLGAGMDLSTLGAQIGPAIVLSLFVLIGNPLIVLAIMGYMGYRKRTGFLAGLTVAQISEFSLIFMAMGVGLGHVGPESIGLVTLVGLVTITVSVYMITWSHQLYDWCAPLLGVFERRIPFRELADDTPGAETRGNDVLVLGLGRFGSRIAVGLAASGLRPLGVDFNPESIRAAREAGLDAVMGDASDPEFLGHLPVAGLRAAILATSGFDGYLFGPAAAQPGCGLWERLLKPTGKPVVSIDIAMCGDPDYTPGLAATLTMQGPAHFDSFLDNAFASCEGECKVAAVGGFVGSDLFTYWEQAIDKAAEKYPNVKVVVDEPANFDPRIALKKIQDALLVHPDIDIIVSSWDDMTRGVEQAVVSAGKVPGEDVKIFSGGATKVGVAKVKAGTWTSTFAYLPYEESYYGAVALMMALEGQPINAYIDEALLPKIVDTIGTPFVTQDNADKYTPNY